MNCIQKSWVQQFNPFLPNGISHPYQLDQSIPILRVVGCYFSFYTYINRIFCNRDQTSFSHGWAQIRLMYVERMLNNAHIINDHTALQFINKKSKHMVFW